MSDEEIAEIIESYVSQLLEFVSTVRIFVTREFVDEDGDSATHSTSRGGGNFYAQIGHVREWLIEQDHRARRHVERQEADCDDDPC